jgi:hypothetical protein
VYGRNSNKTAKDKMAVRFEVVVIPDLETRMTSNWHTVFIEVSCRVAVQERFLGQA